jgi:hypothetical protein
MSPFRTSVCAKSREDATKKCSTIDECKEGESYPGCWDSCVGHMTCSNGLTCVEWVDGCKGEAIPPTWDGEGEGPLLSGGGP